MSDSLTPPPGGGGGDHSDDQNQSGDGSGGHPPGTIWHGLSALGGTLRILCVEAADPRKSFLLLTHDHDPVHRAISLATALRYAASEWLPLPRPVGA